MEDHFDRARLETNDEDSTFPAAEPVSFSQRQTSSFRPDPDRLSGDGVEHGFWNSPTKASIQPSAFPSLPVEPPRRKPSPGRAAFTRVLFMALFGSLTLLLGYALLHRAAG